MLAALSKLPSETLSKSLRRGLDRTAILCQHQDSLLATVLNPPPSSSQQPSSSLLPFLARAQPASLGTEALLRPRLPSFRVSTVTVAGLNDDQMQDVDDSNTFGGAILPSNFESTPGNGRFNRETGTSAGFEPVQDTVNTRINLETKSLDTEANH